MEAKSGAMAARGEIRETLGLDSKPTREDTPPAAEHREHVATADTAPPAGEPGEATTTHGGPPALDPAALPVPLTDRILQSTPEQALAFATRTAKVILAEARRRRWIVKIKQSEHYCIEAWQALGAPYGITASVTKIELLRGENNEVIGAMAWAEARHNPTGRVWGQAIQVCMMDETLRSRDGLVSFRWREHGVHGLVGMASTRACSRALSQVLRWVGTLGGANISGTPSEEMGRV